MTAAIIASMSLGLAACGGDGNKNGRYPANFDKIGDAGRVDFIMKHAPGDSVARFIIFSALGRNPGARIDTMATVTNFAYEKLRGEDLDKFSTEYDMIISSLPLADRMRIYALAGSEDPQGFGYTLGLEYLNTIRDDNKKVADIEKELAEFRKACGNDTATYRRFLIGFKTVLRVDSGKDIPADVYNRFINY